MRKRLVDCERWITVNGTAHWVRVAGVPRATPPIVVVHGGPGGNCYNFERTIGPRLEAFATVIYYEQRGCGRSGAPADPDAYSVPILVEDLESLRGALGLVRIVPLGFSFGGELALEYGLAHPAHTAGVIAQAPGGLGAARTASVQFHGFEFVAEAEIKRQIRDLIAAPMPPEERLARVWQLVDRPIVDRLLFQDQDIARVNRRLWAESGLVNSGAMARALARQPRPAQPLLDRLPALECPALVLIGLHDRNTGIEASRDLAARVPAGELVIFERSAHFPEMEEPERYAAAVQRFLAALTDGACSTDRGG